MTHSCTFSDLMIIMPRICPGNSVGEGGDERVRGTGSLSVHLGDCRRKGVGPSRLHVMVSLLL